MDKSLMLRMIQSVCKFENDKDFARFLGIAPTTLSSWYSRNTFDTELIYAKCVDLNPEWLLSYGTKGNILRTLDVAIESTDQKIDRLSTIIEGFSLTNASLAQTIQDLSGRLLKLEQEISKMKGKKSKIGAEKE